MATRDEQVLEVLRQELKDSGVPVTLSARAEEVAGWDSNATVAIIYAIEDRFGFQMSSTEMESIAGAADIVRIVAHHRPDVA